MSISIRQIVAAASIATAGVLPLGAQTGALLTDMAGVLPDGRWGTSSKETYDVAVRVSLPEIAVGAVSEVMFPIESFEGLSNPKIWFSRALTVESKANVPDIASYEAVYEEGALRLRLDEPVSVGEQGLYVGYSVTVDDNSSPEAKNPVLTLPASEDIFGAGFWVHTSKTYSNKWRDLEEERQTVPAYELRITGLPEAALTVEIPEELYAVKGERTSVEATFRNFGANPVGSMTLSVSNGETQEETGVRFAPADGELLGYPFRHAVSIPPSEESGTFAQRVAVTKVNGAQNASPAGEAVAELYVCSFRPVNRPLFEEYTGTGCGFCPRGALGMERLKETYGDRFVGVAYHCDDIMSIREVAGYPNYCPAQPDSYLNRSVQGDPWFGVDYDVDFGMGPLWQSVADVFAPVGVELSCEWKEEERETVVMTADFTFVRDFEDAAFELAYILCADGLKGTGRNWAQGNYYSGAEPDKWPAEFMGLIESPNPMTGMVYDDVAIALPEPVLLPGAIRRDEERAHTFELSLATAVNLDGQSLVQDKGHLYGVVAVVDSATKKVLNAARCDVPSEYSGLTSVAVDKEPVATSFYDLRGRRIAEPIAGEPCIRVVRHADGTVETTKLL